MAKEAIVLSQEYIDLSIAIQKLFPSQSLSAIQATLADPELSGPYIESMEKLTQETVDTGTALLSVFQSVRKQEADQKAREEEQKFLEVEKRVLDSLSTAKREKVETMRKKLLDNNGDYFEISYRQFILMTDKKEVVETENSVQFLYAHKELDRQELQLPKTKNGAIFDVTYTGFAGEDITRREINQHVLDTTDDDYHYIEEEQERLAKEGKYIATEENTFSSILNGFEGTKVQKIKTMQYFTEFLGRGIISLEKNENGCRRFLGSERGENGIGIYHGDGPNVRGSLFGAKDC